VIRTYAICENRKLVCYHRKKWITQKEVMQDIKDGFIPRFVLKKVYLKGTDDTRRCLINLAANRFKLKISKLSNDKIIEILRDLANEIKP
jgi:hypothetical protein